LAKKSKNTLTVFLITVLVVCSVSTYIALGAEGGSSEDPLVSLSYLTDVFGPQLLKSVDEKISAAGGNAGAGGSVSGYVGFQAVEVKAGQSVLGYAGTEIILRSGEATVLAEGENGLPDTTAGLDLLGKKPLEKNHTYIVPRQDGRGIKMKTDGFLMVKGPYDSVLP